MTDLTNVPPPPPAGVPGPAEAARVKLDDTQPRITRQQIADPTAGIPHMDKLAAAGAVDLRNNARLIDHGNGYASMEPINPEKRIVQPADAAREVKPADAGLLRFLADDIAHTFQCASQDDACICGAEHRAARLRALAEVMEREQRELAHARYVVVANELLPQLTAEWSEPVRVKVQEDDGRVLKLVLKTCDAFGSADLRSARGDR